MSERDERTSERDKLVTRRQFVTGVGIGVTAAVAAGYGFTVWRRRESSVPSGDLVAGGLGAGTPGRTLVVVELGGGNDGFNTVVPLDDAAYRDLRPTLAVTDPIAIDDATGLNPNLPKLAERFAAGEVAIVEGVGYPEPDLSHFGSSDIWWSARGGSGNAGWLGRYLDGTVGFDEPLAAVSIGPAPSRALLGEASFATSMADETGLAPRLPPWADDADDLLAAWSDFAPADVDPSALLGQVQRAIGSTAAAREELTDALGAQPDDSGDDDGPAAGRYGDRTAAESLALAARLAASDVAPRVVYVSGVGDYDTHQGQAERHPVLLEQLDDGIEAFFSALGDGASDVLLMTTSEFGRRPRENGSGTDHGTASAHFFVGAGVNGGRYGERPSLTSVDRAGNVEHTVEFQSMYATALAWLGVDAAPVLGDDFAPLPLVRS